jgi:phage repressor protein C with HTH and peptisase S24 domain
MLSNAKVWTAIDLLAERYGFSASGLARKAGLDPTSFNRSKRKGPDGRERWPSTESLAKVLAATGASLDEFMRLIDAEGDGRRRLPLIGLAQAGAGRFFAEDGMPTGGPGWDEIEFPDVAGEQGFALEVQGDSMWPLFREGDILIVSRTAPVQVGDRVVVRTRGGEVMAKELKRKTAKQLELASLNPDHPDRTIPAPEIDWIARIMWARQ